MNELARKLYQPISAGSMINNNSVSDNSAFVFYSRLVRPLRDVNLHIKSYIRKLGALIACCVRFIMLRIWMMSFKEMLRLLFLKTIHSIVRVYLFLEKVVNTILFMTQEMVRLLLSLIDFQRGPVCGK